MESFRVQSGSWLGTLVSIFCQACFLPTPISEALVRVTGRLNRALGISNLGGYYTGMFTERQLPGK